MKNQWGKIAKKEKKIQDVKNKILNDKLLKMISKYSKKKGKVFDYGCGWGEFADILSRKGFEVSAFDDADEMIKRAKEKFKRPKFYSKKEFYKNISALERKFDLVVSNLVLCILKKAEQDILLENIKRLTKKDGTIIISFCHPCFDYITESVLARRIRPYSYNPKYEKEFKYRKIIHENRIQFNDYHRPLEYYTSLFNEHNLEIIDIAESEILKTEFYPDFIIFVLKEKKE